MHACARGPVILQAGEHTMTVRREREEFVDAPLENVRHCVLRVLNGGRWYYSYIDTVLSDDGLTIDTQVKPKAWTLGLSTPLRISLRQESPGCTVSAQTQSQWYVRGDIFNCYRRFLNDFFTALDTALSQTQA
jgi:hypothetical protein